jgi:uncharacterized protein (DUF1778 family)
MDEFPSTERGKIDKRALISMAASIKEKTTTVRTAEVVP